MGINHFTDEQILELQRNPYVRKVSNKAITYTDEFKKIFMYRYEAGDTPTSILREL
ncbi:MULTISPECIES: HTH domain-containing protein [Clostridium]|uniref:HTH domain-containing protein n=1 Tax=Clostridium TaxID=1485 RepID=UPI002079CCED|nr:MULTISPECIES: HTH domain-containing protein [Clostridium]